MFLGIEFAAKKLIFACLGQGKVRELHLVNWLATLAELKVQQLCSSNINYFDQERS